MFLKTEISERDYLFGALVYNASVTNISTTTPSFNTTASSSSSISDADTQSATPTKKWPTVQTTTFFRGCVPLKVTHSRCLSAPTTQPTSTPATPVNRAHSVGALVESNPATPYSINTNPSSASCGTTAYSELEITSQTYTESTTMNQQDKSVNVYKAFKHNPFAIFVAGMDPQPNMLPDLRKEVGHATQDKCLNPEDHVKDVEQLLAQYNGILSSVVDDECIIFDDEDRLEKMESMETLVPDETPNKLDYGDMTIMIRRTSTNNNQDRKLKRFRDACKAKLASVVKLFKKNKKMARLKSLTDSFFNCDNQLNL